MNEFFNKDTLSLQDRLKTLTFTVGIPHVHPGENIIRIERIRILGQRFRKELDTLYPTLRGSESLTRVIVPKYELPEGSYPTVVSNEGMTAKAFSSEFAEPPRESDLLPRHSSYRREKEMNLSDAVVAISEGITKKECEHLVIVIPEPLRFDAILARFFPDFVSAKGRLQPGSTLILHLAANVAGIIRSAGPETIDCGQSKEAES